MESRWRLFCFKTIYTLVSGLVLISSATRCAAPQPRTVLTDPPQASRPTTASPEPSLASSTQAPLTETPRPSLTPSAATSTLVPATSTATVELASPTAEALIQASPTSLPLSVGCTKAQSRIDEGQLQTTGMPNPLIFQVYLPPCYSARLEHHYPVLYMLHGLNSNEDQWVRLGVTEKADALIAKGQISPMIIVMPLDDDTRQPTESHFGEALVNDLVPWIDAHYATRNDRHGRAIGGLSRGASWAVHVGLTNWKLFGAIGAHSLALFRTDSQQVERLLDDIPWDAYPRIYMDIGMKDEDLASTEDFERELTTRHIPHEWHLFPGFHDEAYWQSHVEDYLIWYSAQW